MSRAAGWHGGSLRMCKGRECNTQADLFPPLDLNFSSNKSAELGDKHCAHVDMSSSDILVTFECASKHLSRLELWTKILAH